MFARFKQKENIEAVERMLAARVELELFERSQLGKGEVFFFWLWMQLGEKRWYWGCAQESRKRLDG